MFFLQGLSPENALIFKKVVKKDATTKIKGLEELRGFFEQEGAKDHENMDAVLHKWVAEFPRLVEDNSPKVRLLALRLMGLIGQTLKSYVLMQVLHLASDIPPLAIRRCHQTEHQPNLHL